MRIERRFGPIVLGALTLGFAAVVVAVAAAAWAFGRTQEMNRLLAHTYEVELALSEIRTLTERVETSRRGFIISSDERFSRAFAEVETRLEPVLKNIETLTRDNPSQVARAVQLRKGVEDQRDDVVASFEALRSLGDAQARKAFVDDGSANLIRELRNISGEMVAEEQGLLERRRERQAASLFRSYVILGLAGIVLLVVAAGTIWIVRRNLADLKGSRDSLRDLNENLELAVETRTSDLQRANDEIQRFAYIVSHDLRSPLVNIMGFTSELDEASKALSGMLDTAETEAPHIVSSDARTAAREDLPEAIGFIRSSTQKMDRLINAILRLSREGRRVIAPERLDVGEILQAITASLAHRISEVGAEIAIVRPLPTVVSDRLAVEQILSNLVENALKYRDPKRAPRIAVRGTGTGGGVVFEIEDNGRGVDPRDHERIFDLFRRSGVQDQQGEGIGLAHVRALAYRLGGKISCKSEIGKGSTFALSLPSVYKPRKEG